MIIERLDLHAYGHLTDQSFDFTSQAIRFHIICGANEAGKSTTLRAITNWLFGFGHTTDDDYLHRSNQLRVGGRLKRDDGQVLDCIRRKGRVATLRGSDDETIIDDSQLQNMLGGINESTFTTQFGLSHDELQRGGQQILRGEGEIGEILFSAGAGISRLQDIQSKLQSDLAGLFRTRARNASINQALQQVDGDRKLLRQLQLPPATYVQLQTELAEQAETIKKLNEKSEDLTRRRTVLQATATALESLPKIQLAIAAFNEVAQAPTLSDDFTDRWRQIQRDRAFQELELEKCIRRRDELFLQSQTIGEEDPVVVHCQTIEELSAELPLREKGESDRGRLVTRIRQLDDQMRQQLRDFAGWEDESNDGLSQRIESLHLNATQRTTIQRLATQYERLVQLRDDAQAEVRQTEVKIAQIDRQLDELPEATDPEPLTRALEEMGPPETLLASLDERQHQMQTLLLKCESIVKRMGLSIDVENAFAIPFADNEEVESLAKQLEAQQQAIDLAESRVSESENEWRAAERELDCMDDSESLPTVTDLIESRQHRDQSILSLRDKETSRDLWEKTIGLIKQCDHIADLFRTHHEAIHRRQAAADAVERRRQRHAQRSMELTEEIEQLEQLQDLWQALWTPLGVPARTPKSMRQFCSDQRQLAEEYERYRQAHGSLELVQRRVMHACASIKAAFSDPTSDSCVDDLQTLHVHAARVRNQLVEQKSLRDRWLTTRSELAADLTLAQLNLSNRIADWTKWQQDWQLVTQQISTEATQTPTEVLPILDAITQLANDKRERDGLHHQMEIMTAESEGYLLRCSHLFARLDDPTLTPANDGRTHDLKSAGTLVTRLRQRLEDERLRSVERERTHADLQSCELELEQWRTRVQKLRIASQQLCSECGVVDWEQIEGVERRARQKALALIKLEDAKSILMRWSGGKPLELFVEELETLDPQAVHEELSTIVTMLEELQTQLADEQKKFWGLESELSRINGGDSASELSQSIQLKIGRLRRDVELYVRLNLANQILSRAIEHYRAENQDPVLAAARGYFQTITCGEYTDLKDEIDSNKGVPTMLGVRGEVPVPTTQMSTGTADALYLALRLASLKHQLSDGETIPLIIDDCLIQLDDDRASAALKVFAELSKTTQIILFTHHQHLVDLAKHTLEPDSYQVHHFSARER